jgi:hypothetical protein
MQNCQIKKKSIRDSDKLEVLVNVHGHNTNNPSINRGVQS